MDSAALNKVSAVVSTILSGASNVLLQLLAAHYLSASAFARFVLSSATIFLVLGLARAVVGQTDLIRGDRGRDEGTTAAAYVFAGFVGGVGLLVMVVSRFGLQHVMVPVGMSLLLAPLFVLQDCVRFRSFRRMKSQWAFASDLVVFVMCLSGFLVLGGTASPAGLLLIWGGATAIGWVMLVGPLEYWGSLRTAPVWWRENRDLVVPGGWEYVLQSAVPYALYWVVLSLGGAAALAGYRVVQIIFGGLANFAQGVAAFELPQLSAAPSGRDLRSLMVRNAALLLVPALCLYVVVARMPIGAGLRLFGGSWRDAPEFLLAGSVHAIVNALLVVNFQVLRILGEARYSLVVRIVTVLLIPVVCIVAGKIYGAVGIAWGLALVSAFGYILRLAKVLERTNEMQHA